MTDDERRLLLLLADIVGGDLIPATRPEACELYELVERIKEHAKDD